MKKACNVIGHLVLPFTKTQVAGTRQYGGVFFYSKLAYSNIFRVEIELKCQNCEKIFIANANRLFLHEEMRKNASEHKDDVGRTCVALTVS